MTALWLAPLGLWALVCVDYWRWLRRAEMQREQRETAA